MNATELISKIFSPLSLAIIMLGMGIPIAAYSIWMFVTGGILMWKLGKRKVG